MQANAVLEMPTELLDLPDELLALILRHAMQYEGNSPSRHALPFQQLVQFFNAFAFPIHRNAHLYRIAREAFFEGNVFSVDAPRVQSRESSAGYPSQQEVIFEWWMGQDLWLLEDLIHTDIRIDAGKPHAGPFPPQTDCGDVEMQQFGDYAILLNPRLRRSLPNIKTASLHLDYGDVDKKGVLDGGRNKLRHLMPNSVHQMLRACDITGAPIVSASLWEWESEAKRINVRKMGFTEIAAEMTKTKNKVAIFLL